MKYEKCIALHASAKVALVDLSANFEGELNGSCDSFINDIAGIEFSVIGGEFGYYLALCCWALGETIEIKTDAESVLEVRAFIKKYLNEYYRRIHGLAQMSVFDMEEFTHA